MLPSDISIATSKVFVELGNVFHSSLLLCVCSDSRVPQLDTLEKALLTNTPSASSLQKQVMWRKLSLLVPLHSQNLQSVSLTLLH